MVLVLHGNTTDVQDAYGCYHCMWYEYYTEIQPMLRLGITLVVLYVVLVLHGNTTRNISIWYEYGMKTQQYLYNNNNIKKKLTV